MPKRIITSKRKNILSRINRYKVNGIPAMDAKDADSIPVNRIKKKGCGCGRRKNKS